MRVESIDCSVIMPIQTCKRLTSVSTNDRLEEWSRLRDWTLHGRQPRSGKPSTLRSIRCALSDCYWKGHTLQSHNFSLCSEFVKMAANTFRNSNRRTPMAAYIRSTIHCSVLLDRLEQSAIDQMMQNSTEETLTVRILLASTPKPHSTERFLS